KLGLKYSARFSLAGSFSGAPLATDTSYHTLLDAFGPAGSPSRAENDLLALAREARVAAGTYFYIDCGSADELLAENRAFVQAMSARPLAYEYHEVPGAHGWEYWDRRLPVFLRLVEERIARLPDAGQDGAW
ncbi:MAG TPA: alpha/beta hydrolase-fold protein, partial [Longimicrobium sp.]|nr:alpha/beta hydrolase-fold protein [Longimicrobium sp.]